MTTYYKNVSVTKHYSFTKYLDSTATCSDTSPPTSYQYSDADGYSGTLTNYSDSNLTNDGVQHSTACNSDYVVYHVDRTFSGEVSKTVSNTAPTTSLSKVSSTSSSIRVNAYYSDSDGDNGLSKIEYYANGSLKGAHTFAYSGSVSKQDYYTISGLSAGTSYNITAKFYDYSGSLASSITHTYSTDAADNPPNIPTRLSPADGISTTNDTVTFSATVSDPDGDYTSLVVEVSLYSDFSNKSVLQSSEVASGSTASVTSSPLGYNTYYWRAYASNSSSSGYTSTRTITIYKPRPSTFEWDTPKTGELGVDCDLTASEWNGITQNCNAVRNYLDMSDYVFTTVSTTDKFMANIFNEMVNAVSDMNPPTSPPSIKSGVSSTQFAPDDILPSDLNLLRDSLNSVQ